MPWYDGDSRSVSYGFTASDKDFARVQTNGFQPRVSQLLAAKMTKRPQDDNLHERGSKGVGPIKERTANAPEGLPEAPPTYRRDIDEMHYNVLLRSLNLERVLSGNQAFKKIKKTLVRIQRDKALASNLAAGDFNHSQSAPRYLLDLRYISWQLAELASLVNVAVVDWKPIESIDAQARKDLNAWLHAKNLKVSCFFFAGIYQACSLMIHDRWLVATPRAHRLTFCTTIGMGLGSKILQANERPKRDRRWETNYQLRPYETCRTKRHSQCQGNKSLKFTE